MTRGAFITVEGGDGAGKTTQINYIVEQLNRRDISVLKTREPGGTALGEKLRTTLLTENQCEISDNAELLLLFAARCQHLEEVIIPALNRGQWVLCDRFTDATFAYQGGGRGISEQRIEALNLWVNPSLDINLTILLDISPHQGIERTDKRSQQTDRFEQQDLIFKEKVRQTYLDRAEQNPRRIKIVDAGLDIPQVQGQIDDVLTEFIDQFPNQP